MNPDLELTLPARAENVAVVRHAFGGLGDVLDVPDQTLSDIKLAVTEACTNVVVHAYPDREGELGVRALVDDRRLCNLLLCAVRCGWNCHHRQRRAPGAVLRRA